MILVGLAHITIRRCYRLSTVIKKTFSKDDVKDGCIEPLILVPADGISDFSLPALSELTSETAQVYLNYLIVSAVSEPGDKKSVRGWFRREPLHKQVLLMLKALLSINMTKRV